MIWFFFEFLGKYIARGVFLMKVERGWYWTDQAEKESVSGMNLAGERVWEERQHHIPKDWIARGLVVWVMLVDDQVTLDVELLLSP